MSQTQDTLETKDDHSAGQGVEGADSTQKATPQSGECAAGTYATGGGCGTQKPDPARSDEAQHSDR